MTWALPIWTLVVWATRIRNVVEQDGVAASLVLPVAMTVLAVVALVDRRRGLLALAATTIAVWAVRLPLVLVRDHPASFKVVHAVLAVVSVALALDATRRGLRRRTPPPVTAVGTPASDPHRSD